MRTTLLLIAALSLSVPATVAAQQQAIPGPVIFSAGNTFPVDNPSFVTRTDIEYKVAFELAAAAPSPDQLNTSLNSVARFINMHAADGVPVTQIKAAVVVHGPAGWELLSDEAYREKYGVDNPNSELIRELVDQGMTIVLCGQTAASRGIPRDGLADGVQLALSAMTAFVVLQADGYTVNPW